MSTGISIAALAVSALALIIAFSESVVRRRAVRAEQTDRQAQLEILHKQVARARRAELAVSQTNAFRWIFNAEYEFRVTNVGQACARDVRAVLVDADAKTSLSATVPLPKPLGSGESQTIKLKVPHVPRHDRPRCSPTTDRTTKATRPAESKCDNTVSARRAPACRAAA